MIYYNKYIIFGIVNKFLEQIIQNSKMLSYEYKYIHRFVRWDNLFKLLPLAIFKASNLHGIKTESYESE